MQRSACSTVARLSVVAAAVWLALNAPASAVVLVDGSWSSNDNVPIGPGDTLWPTRGLYVGNGSPGSLRVDGGSLLQVASLVFGRDQIGNGTGLLTGSGSRIELTGNGFDQGSVNRFEVGGWGNANVTVAAGAVLDGRANSAACLGQFHYCNNFIGNAAGSTGTFTITGAGSSASFLRTFGVGGLAVFHPPIDAFTFGTPGGTTRGTVNVLAGGLLTTDGATLGMAPGGGSPTGTERSFADVTINGAGSLWRVTGGTLEPGQYANVSTATHRNAWATLAITGGGEMRLEGDGNKYTVLNLSSGGGRTDMLVSGAGSRLRFVGTPGNVSSSGIFNIGTSSFGTAVVELRDGALADGMFYTGVGRNGALASLLVDGAGTLLRIDGTATAAANTVTGAAAMEIGRNGGNGTVTVSNGARIELLTTTATTNGIGLTLARDSHSAGTLNISGAGSVVSLGAASVLPGGGVGEAANPLVRVGRDGNGSLNITGGGKLLIDGQAVSTVANSRSTNLYIGGTGDSTVGGKGIALVSGAGSEIRMTGSDTFIAVGIGPQSFGQLTVANGAAISAIGMNVGRSGGVGVLAVDNAMVNFSGQQTGNVLAGAFLSIGRSGGTGIANIGNGTVVTLNNQGSSGASVNLGGTGPGPLGDGTLNLSGGSKILVQAAPGLASVVVARDGSALMRVRGASTVDVGDGSLFVGRLKGSDGTLIVSEGSTINAGWVGVGRNKTASGDEDGGTGTFVLTNSTLNATDIVIGTNGFLGGSGTINGNVTNHGIFAPGNSPGTMEITGSFTAAAGSRLILEVESDGQGGFKTDQVIFGSGPVDLAHLAVEFRFLGNTNPNDFQQANLFTVDTFFQRRNAGGGTTDLAAEAFAAATFDAQADAYSFDNFSFSATGGASFTATPVPEAGTQAMLAAGLLALGWLSRRRRRGG